jgi:hypothetical protein
MGKKLSSEEDDSSWSSSESFDQKHAVYVHARHRVPKKAPTKNRSSLLTQICQKR